MRTYVCMHDKRMQNSVEGYCSGPSADKWKWDVCSIDLTSLYIRKTTNTFVMAGVKVVPRIITVFALNFNSPFTNGKGFAPLKEKKERKKR